MKEYETVKYKCSFCGAISNIIKHTNQKEFFMGWCFNPNCDNSKMHKQILCKPKLSLKKLNNYIP